MSDADRAYEAAKRLIEEAREEAFLDLDTPDTKHLTALPPEILELKFLKTLWLDGTSITDDGIAILGQGSRLEVLWLGGTAITDLGIKMLAGLRKLKGLRLDNTRITDSALTHITEMKGIQSLRLDRTNVTDAGLKVLNELQHLSSLYLSNTKITERGLGALIGLHRLQRLWIDACPVRDLRFVGGMDGLLDGAKLGGGLSFAGTLATKLDPVLRGLSKIEDRLERTSSTLVYIRGLGPEYEEALTSADDHLRHSQMAESDETWTDANGPIVPDEDVQRLSPLQVEFAEMQLVPREEAGSKLSASDAEARAQAGWEALREFHDDVAATLMKDNLPNLKRALVAFDRALGVAFAELRVIALGTHGQRIIDIAKSADELLMDDGAGELKAFAAAIATYLNRFPDWQAFLQDGDLAQVKPEQVAQDAGRFAEFGQALVDADWVDDGIGLEYGAQVVGVADDAGAAVPARGLVASTNALLAVMAEKVLDGWRTSKKSVGDFVRDTAKEARDIGVKATAAALATAVSTGVASAADLLLNKAQLLMWLSTNYPVQLGWVGQFLKFFGWA